MFRVDLIEYRKLVQLDLDKYDPPTNKHEQDMKTGLEAAMDYLDARLATPPKTRTLLRKGAEGEKDTYFKLVSKL